MLQVVLGFLLRRVSFLGVTCMGHGESLEIEDGFFSVRS